MNASPAIQIASFRIVSVCRFHNAFQGHTLEFQIGFVRVVALLALVAKMRRLLNAEDAMPPTTGFRTRLLACLLAPSDSTPMLQADASVCNV